MSLIFVMIPGALREARAKVAKMAQFGKRGIAPHVTPASSSLPDRTETFKARSFLLAAGVALCLGGIAFAVVWSVSGQHGLLAKAPQPANAAVLTDADPIRCAANLGWAMRQARDAGPVRTVARVTLKGQDVQVTSETRAPDAFRNVSPRSGGTIEIIMIGGQAWRNDGDGWVSYPHSADETQKFVQHSLAMFDPPFQEAACIGMRDIEGRSLAAISYKHQDSGQISRTSAYFDPQTGLPAAMSLDGTSEGAPVHIEMTIEFDRDMAILAPEGARMWRLDPSKL